MMIYETTTDGAILSVAICFLILWLMFRSEKKNKAKKKRELKEKRNRENQEASRKAKETVRKMEEEKQKREEKFQKRREECKTVEVYLTEEQNNKGKYCEKKSGDFMISANAIYMLYQVLHQPTVEKQEILDLLGEGEPRYYNVFVMDKDDKERMEYCKEWLGVGETEVYAVGIEIYRQYLTQ